MLVKFSEVGINEKFTFVSKYSELCTLSIKTGRYSYIDIKSGKAYTTRYTTNTCEVDNSCACTEPRQLTFNDLSIGAIFIIGGTWYAQVDNEHKYCKLDNMHYSNFYDSRLFTISSIKIVVSTPDYVRSAQ